MFGKLNSWSKIAVLAIGVAFVGCNDNPKLNPSTLNQAIQNEKVQSFVQKYSNSINGGHFTDRKLYEQFDKDLREARTILKSHDLDHLLLSEIDENNLRALANATDNYVNRLKEIVYKVENDHFNTFEDYAYEFRDATSDTLKVKEVLKTLHKHEFDLDWVNEGLIYVVSQLGSKKYDAKLQKLKQKAFDQSIGDEDVLEQSKIARSTYSKVKHLSAMVQRYLKTP